MKNKRVISMLLAAILILSMTACNGAAGSTPEVSTDTAKEETSGDNEAVTITLQIDKDSPIEGIEAVIAAIEKDLNIKTEVEIRASGSEGDNVIKTRLASGDMADIFLHNCGAQLQSLNPGEYLMDISDQPFTENLIADFKTAASVDGKIYGVPAFSTQAGAWLYNKRVYEELNLSVPKTWDELMTNCETIKAAGQTAIIGAYKDDWTSQLVLLSDNYNVLKEYPEFPTDFTENKAKYETTPAALRSFEKLAQTKQYLNEDYLATTYDVALDMLANQEGAHFPMLTQGIASISALSPELVNDIGVFAQPGDSGEPGLTVWMPAAFYGNDKSDKKDAILKWMEYYISQKGIDTYATAVKPNGPYAVIGVELPEDAYEGVKDMQPYFDSGNTALALEFESPVKGANAPQICVSVGAGIISPEEGASQYDQDMEKQAIQLNLPGW